VTHKCLFTAFSVVRSQKPHSVNRVVSQARPQLSAECTSCREGTLSLNWCCWNWRQIVERLLQTLNSAASAGKQLHLCRECICHRFFPRLMSQPCGVTWSRQRLVGSDAQYQIAIRFKYQQVNDHIIMQMGWASDWYQNPGVMVTHPRVKNMELAVWGTGVPGLLS